MAEFPTDAVSTLRFGQSPIYSLSRNDTQSRFLSGSKPESGCSRSPLTGYRPMPQSCSNPCGLGSRMEPRRTALALSKRNNGNVRAALMALEMRLYAA